MASERDKFNKAKFDERIAEIGQHVRRNVDAKIVPPVRPVFNPNHNSTASFQEMMRKYERDMRVYKEKMSSPTQGHVGSSKEAELGDGIKDSEIKKVS